MQKKRITAAIVTVILVLSSFVASAEWVSAGFDTRQVKDQNDCDVYEVFNEVIDGKYTGKFKSELLPASDIEWKFDGYEFDYPHAGYDRLFVKGEAQRVWAYNNLFPQWETRFVDCYWEIGFDHTIYQRQQTNIPGKGWKFDYSANAAINAKLLTPTTRNAVVADTFAAYGVGPFDLNGEFVTPEVMDMYNEVLADDGIDYDNFQKACIALGVDNRTEYNEVEWAVDDFGNLMVGTYNVLNPNELSKLKTDGSGDYVVSDAEIAEAVFGIVSKYTTGPVYNNDGVAVGNVTKDVAAEYLANDTWEWDIPKTPSFVNGADSDIVKEGTEVAWVYGGFEQADPYRNYEILVVNGVVFDGSNDLPYIWRYTGGVSDPEVEWRYAFCEFDGMNDIMLLNNRYPAGVVLTPAQIPFKVIEVKFVNGNMAFENGAPVYRYTEEIAKPYVRITETDIEVWLRDDVSDVMIFSVNRVHPTLGGYASYAPGAIWVIR